jgi:hypothetical protein
MATALAGRPRLAKVEVQNEITPGMYVCWRRRKLNAETAETALIIRRSANKKN